eukprot:Rhum_TRINITY_DN8172_c0_g1::Rhum_TRINITY_DN8172_c0_g1_i1::g.26550::m.26550
MGYGDEGGGGAHGKFSSVLRRRQRPHQLEEEAPLKAVGRSGLVQRHPATRRVGDRLRDARSGSEVTQGCRHVAQQRVLGGVYGDVVHEREQVRAVVLLEVTRRPQDHARAREKPGQRPTRASAVEADGVAVWGEPSQALFRVRGPHAPAPVAHLRRVDAARARRQPSVPAQLHVAVHAPLLLRRTRVGVGLHGHRRVDAHAGKVAQEAEVRGCVGVAATVHHAVGEREDALIAAAAVADDAAVPPLLRHRQRKVVRVVVHRRRPLHDRHRRVRAHRRAHGVLRLGRPHGAVARDEEDVCAPHSLSVPRERRPQHAERRADVRLVRCRQDAVAGAAHRGRPCVDGDVHGALERERLARVRRGLVGVHHVGVARTAEVRPRAVRVVDLPCEARAAAAAHPQHLVAVDAREAGGGGGDVLVAGAADHVAGRVAADDRQVVEAARGRPRVQVCPAQQVQRQVLGYVLGARRRRRRRGGRGGGGAVGEGGGGRLRHRGGFATVVGHAVPDEQDAAEDCGEHLRVRRRAQRRQRRRGSAGRGGAAAAAAAAAAPRGRYVAAPAPCACAISRCTPVAWGGGSVGRHPDCVHHPRTQK